MGSKLITGVNDLVTYCKQNNREDLLKQWHAVKNDELRPSDISAFSSRKVWWYLPYDVPMDYKVEHLRGKHYEFEWMALVSNRVNGAGCPFLSNNLIWQGYNDLASVAPYLLSQWDYKKNGNMKPDEVTAYSKKKVWWIGQCGHEWEASIQSRSGGVGCPICSGKNVLVGYNDLATTHQTLIEEWDYEKNTILPTDISAGSNRIVWWKCNLGHTWKTSVCNRTAKEATNCPYCSNHKISIGYNDFKTYCKQEGKEYLLEEWDYEKNSISPQNILAKSSQKVHWICINGHRWSAVIADRSSGHGCPKCRLKGTSFPEQAVYYYVHKFFPDAINGDKEQLVGKELDIYIPSIKTAIEYDGEKWHKNRKESDEVKSKLCAEKDIYLIRIVDIINEQDTITENMSIYGHKLNDYYDLSRVIEKILLSLNISDFDVNVTRDNTLIMNLYKFESHEKSIAVTHPQLLSEWNYELNGRIKPEMFSSGSNQKLWWTCENGHDFKQSISRRAYGEKCPYCSGRKVMAGYNDLATVNLDLLSEWDYEENKEYGPSDVTVGSSKKIHWICKKGHKWIDSPGHRACSKLGCPFCSNRRVLKGYNDLATISPSLLKEWDYESNNGLTPEMVVYSSRKKANWICEKGHKWEAVINSRSLGHGCPYCANIIAKKVQCVETGEVFDSLSEASRSTNISISSLHKSVHDEKKIAGGFHWKYV